VKLTVAGIGSWSGTAGARPRSPPSPLRSRRGWAAVSGFRCRRRRADLMAATRSPASSRATVHSRLGPRPEPGREAWNRVPGWSPRRASPDPKDRADRHMTSAAPAAARLRAAWQ
jgi:hypothetical protein